MARSETSQPSANGKVHRLSPSETAAYSRDMLSELKSIAERQRHYRLATLLEAAALEAERLSRSAGSGAASDQ